MFDSSQIQHVSREAEKLNVEPAMFLALIEKESAGRLFWIVNGKPLPAIRFEGHYFYRRLRGDKQQEAVDEGLAHPRAGYVRNPRSYAGRYRMLERAMRIDPDAAIESTSWGLGQVMGAHWRRLGYKSARELRASTESGFYGQVDLIFRFIQKNGLVDEFQRRDFDGIGYRYNGPLYRRNKYAVTLKRLFKKWSRILNGKNVSHTEDLVKLLKKANFPVSRYGSLRQSVRAFQASHDLVVDGIAGPMTIRTLEEVAEGRSKNAFKKIVKAAATAAPPVGFGVSEINDVMFAVDDAKNAGDTARNFLEIFGLPTWIVGAAAVLIMAVVLYFTIQALFNKEETHV